LGAGVDPPGRRRRGGIVIHPAWAGSGFVWIPGGCNPSVWVRSGWIRWILWVRGSAALCQRRRSRDARDTPCGAGGRGPRSSGFRQ
jgi:hypothetical protein